MVFQVGSRQRRHGASAQNASHTIKFTLLRAKHSAEQRREGSCTKNETVVNEQVSDVRKEGLKGFVKAVEKGQQVCQGEATSLVLETLNGGVSGRAQQASGYESSVDTK